MKRSEAFTVPKITVEWEGHRMVQVRKEVKNGLLRLRLCQNLGASGKKFTKLLTKNLR